jgi:WD40 repeat protein
MTGWTRLSQQISKERWLYGSRELLERLCLEWADPERGKRKGNRLLEGFPLAQGRQLLAEWGEKSLIDKVPELPEFIAASIRRDRLRGAAKYTAVAVVIATFAIGLSMYKSYEQARVEADAASAIARSQADLRDGDTMSAVTFARTAFDKLPSEQSRSTLASALLDISPHLVATFDVGNDISPAIAWIGDTKLAFLPRTDGGTVRIIDIESRRATQTKPFPMPNVIRQTDGNRANIEVMRALPSERLMTVFNEGTLGLLLPGAVPSLHKVPTGTLNGAGSASIGTHGSLIVTLSIAGDVVGTECGIELAMPLKCVDHPVEGVSGKVVAVNHDETRFAVGDRSGLITVYDRVARRVIEPVSIGGTPTAFAWSSSDRLAVATAKNEIAIIKPGSPNPEASQRTDTVTSSLSWSNDGKSLAFPCGHDVWVWLATPTTEGNFNFEPIRRLEGHSAPVNRVEWSPDGRRLASESNDGTIRIWSLEQNRDVTFAFYAERPTQLFTVAVSADGDQVAAGSEDGTIRIWDSSSGKLLSVVESRDNASPVTSLAWSRSGELAACHDDETITIVSMGEPHEVRRVHEARCTRRIVFTGAGRKIAMPQRGSNLIVLMIPEDPTKLTEIDLRDVDPWGIATDDRGTQLFVNCGNDGVPAVIDINNKRLVKMTPTSILGGNGGESLSVSTGGKWLASSGSDRYVRIYDVSARAGAGVLLMEQDEPNVVAFSPHGARLAALGQKNRLYVWDSAFSADRLVAIDMQLAKPLVSGDWNGSNYGWMAWLTTDSIVVAAGTSAMRVVNVAPMSWNRRIDAIAPVKIHP